MQQPVIRLDHYELRLSTRELVDRGRPLRIGERAFEVLRALAEAGGYPVARDILFERVWPGRAVLDDNLKVQVMALRKLLGAQAIATVPGVGYRLTLSCRPSAEAGPSLTGLIGRDSEMSRSLDLVAPGTVLTLVGSSGIGKTRLAQAIASAVQARFDDGTAFVELAPLTDAGTIVPTIARVLRLGPAVDAAAMQAALARMRLLLVLDSAERLRAAVAHCVAAVLSAAPGIAIVVTSQEALGLEGERLLRLEGLSGSAAQALFVERVRGLQPEFELAGDEAAAVARIVARLDGIPLALELAAARVLLLGPTGVEQRLGNALALLSRGVHGAPLRHQTLRAALEWSHGLLDDAGKAVFRRLAVFAGSFTVATAEIVATDARRDRWAVVDALESLVEKSLVERVHEAGTPRLRLLDVVRQFALERLAEAGETTAVRQQHAEAMASLFEAADARFTATPALAWQTELLPELPDLRAAVHWALGIEGDDVLAIRLCAAAGGFWAMTGLHAESAQPLLRLAGRVNDRVPLATQARFWLAVANHASGAISWQRSFEAVELAASLARRAGQPALLHRALGHRLPLAQRIGVAVDAEATVEAMRAVEADDWTPLQRRARRSAEAFQWYAAADWPRFCEASRRELRVLREAGDLYRAWMSAHKVALAECALGRPDQALPLMQTAVDEIRSAGMLRHCWQQVALLALCLIETGDAPPAPVHEAVRLMRDAGALPWIGCHLAEWLTQQSRMADAARLLGWVARRHANSGQAAGEQGERARVRALAAIATSATAAEMAAWQTEGERWNEDDAALALLA